MSGKNRVQDTMTVMLESKRSQATQDTYRKHLEYFFREMEGKSVKPLTVEAFLKLSRAEAIEKVLKYKNILLSRNLAENTINARISAIKALVNFARHIDRCGFDLTDIVGEKAKPYRDTSGLTANQMKMVLLTPNRGMVRGIRDYVILLLLWGNALRRGEITRLNVGDLDSSNRLLFILGKGRGMQKESIFLSEKTTLAICDWLEVRGEAKPIESPCLPPPTTDTGGTG